MPVTMVPSGAQISSNELSERQAEVPMPANQNASDVTSFWRTRDHLLYPYYMIFLYNPKSPHKYCNIDQTIALKRRRILFSLQWYQPPLSTLTTS